MSSLVWSFSVLLNKNYVVYFVEFKKVRVIKEGKQITVE